MELHMFRTVSLSIVRSRALNTQQQVYVIHVQVLLTARLASSQHNLYDIYLLLCVQCRTADDGQRDSPKHVEIHSKNKFEKLVHLVGFVIRIYHDARSSECQICSLDRQNVFSPVSFPSITRIAFLQLVFLHRFSLMLNI